MTTYMNLNKILLATFFVFSLFLITATQSKPAMAAAVAVDTASTPTVLAYYYVGGPRYRGYGYYRRGYVRGYYNGWHGRACYRHCFITPRGWRRCVCN